MKKIPAPRRPRFPDDEKRLTWLPLLLDAQAVVDEGVSLAITAETQRRGAGPACAKGCTVCCRSQKDIPVYPLELVGMYWFVIEKLAGPGREAVKKQLLNHARWAACPFLVNDLCAIYPRRPLACRQFIVFGRPCAEGEDPYHTRRGDVLTPLKAYTRQALYFMLPFHGVRDESDKLRLIESDLLHSQARVLQSLNWQELAGRMDDFDFKQRITESTK